MNRFARYLVAAAAGAVASLPLSSEAAMECKPDPMAVMALTQSVAIGQWETNVTNAYGAAWADFDNAAAKYFSETNLGVATLQQVSARPCRVVAFRLAPQSLLKYKLIPTP